MSNGDIAWMRRTAANSLELADMALARRDTAQALAQVEIAQQMLLGLQLAEERDQMRIEMAANDLAAIRSRGF